MSAPVPSDGTLGLALRHLLDRFTPAELDELVAGRARLELHRIDAPAAPCSEAPARRRRPLTPVPAHAHGVDVPAAAAHIHTLATPAEVDAYLQSSGFTLPVLKQLARALGPTVLATGRNKTEVRRDIVAGTAGFRARSAAMSGGAWA